jgi:Ca2+-binding EF-hand superfamily protein
VVNYVEDMLNRYDQNKDGYVDSNEWASGRWSTPPEESDTNKDNRLSKDELLVRIAKRFGSQPGGDGSSNNSEQVRRFADSLIRQYDKNSDGRLQADEWKEMRTEHQSADADRDGIITTDELAVKLTNYASGSPASSSSGSFGSSGTSSGSVGRSVRFLTAAERLPAGLPSWFFDKDADQDGQVKMSEYATSWSESAATEFATWDRDGDGIITAKECLKQAETTR